MRRSIAPPGLKAGICGKVNAPRGKTMRIVAVVQERLTSSTGSAERNEKPRAGEWRGCVRSVACELRSSAKELLFLAVSGAPLSRLGGTLDRVFRLRLGFRR